MFPRRLTMGVVYSNRDVTESKLTTHIPTTCVVISILGLLDVLVEVQLCFLQLVIFGMLFGRLILLVVTLEGLEALSFHRCGRFLKLAVCICCTSLLSIQ